MKVEIQQLECQRCGYKWIPRTGDVRLCARCKSPYWDTVKEHNQRGRGMEDLSQPQNMELKREVLSHYSPNGVVKCCGSSHPANDSYLTDLVVLFLSARGYKGNDKRRSGMPFYQSLKAHGYPPGFEVLCLNCKAIKRIEDREKRKVALG